MTFTEIECKKCENKQMIFNKPAMEIVCNKCKTLLVKPNSSKPVFTKDAKIVVKQIEEKKSE